MARILSEAQRQHGRDSSLHTVIASNLRAAPLSAPLHTLSAATDDFLVRNPDFDSPISLFRDERTGELQRTIGNARHHPPPRHQRRSIARRHCNNMARHARGVDPARHEPLHGCLSLQPGVLRLRRCLSFVPGRAQGLAPQGHGQPGAQTRRAVADQRPDTRGAKHMARRAGQAQQRHARA